MKKIFHHNMKIFHFLLDFSPTCIYICSAICQESYWLKYLSLARHIAAGFWCLYYSSVCLVYIWTTNCKQSQTRTTVFWIGERKKKDCFGKVPLILLMNVVILTSFFGIYEISLMVARLAFWKYIYVLFHLCF